MPTVFSDFLMRVESHIKARKFLAKNRFKVIAWQQDGKKYLAVMETNRRGVKWKRKFEVVNELDDNMKPIPFRGREAVKL